MWRSSGKAETVFLQVSATPVKWAPPPKRGGGVHLSFQNLVSEKKWLNHWHRSDL